ncbi:MAG: flippase-like domain-containing protein, partial [Akkermansiaceae bacterium]|nr:flippase-like domain-containing protein [Verrucomicrobiales bacterium]
TLFLPAAVRWHLALKASGANIQIAAAIRISLIGHFFYTILFGAAGGDTAKSALYSRWHGLPLTKILATSSLDRLLGFIGLIVFTTGAFALAATHGGLGTWGSVSLRWPAGWLIAALLVIALVVIWLKRSPAESPQIHFLQTLAVSGRKLIRSPRNLSAGIGCAIAVQVALSGVLALCLAAVSPEPLPWARLAWTFPVISVVSALPITFAGLGVRDSAAVVLFGLSQVPASTAIAASLLTAAVSLIWAVIGAILLWREAVRNEPDFQLRSFWTLVPH